MRVSAFQTILAQLDSDARTVCQMLGLEGYHPLVVGGMAVQHHGLMRLTDDIDLLFSAQEYNKLVEDNRIKYGTLKYKSGVQVDVLSEGKDGNPNPELIRMGSSIYPTLEGLIWLKLISKRLKDQGDIAELMKIYHFDEGIIDNVQILVSKDQFDLFLSIMDQACKEQEHAEFSKEKESQDNP